MGARNEAEARAFVLSRLRRRVGLVVVREMARHRLRRLPYIGVPRHIVEERMQPFHLRAIERGGGAAVSAADFYAFAAGKKGIEPYHQVCRVLYKPRPHLFLYDPDLY